MKERSKTVIKIGIIAVGMCDTGSGATNGALMAIMAAMPDVPANLVQMIQSVPALFIALLPILYSFLISKGCRKRPILLVGAILLVVGGVMPFWMHGSIWVILFWRAVFGAGNGLLLPMASDLVIDFFDGKERTTVQGWASAAFSLSGVVFQLLGGWFCEISWEYTFLAYAVAIIFFAIALACVPEPDRAAKIESEAAAIEESVQGGKKPSLGMYALLIAVVYGCFEFFWYVNANNAAVVIMGEGLAEPAMIGTMMSLMSWSGLIMGIIFGAIVNKIGLKTFAFGFIFAIAGMFIANIADTKSLFSVAIFLIGLAQGTVTPSAIVAVTNSVPYAVGARAVSSIYIALGIGGFIQPMVFGLFPAVAIGRPAYMVAAIGIIVVMLLMWVVVAAAKKNAQPGSPWAEQKDAQ